MQIGHLVANMTDWLLTRNWPLTNQPTFHCTTYKQKTDDNHSLG